MNATIGNSLSEIPRVAAMVEALGAENNLSSEVVFDVQLALEEVLANTIHHGYTDTSPHHISIRLNVEAGVVVAEVEDDGAAFNLLEAPEPDLTSALRDRRVGGLGVRFVRMLMDGIEYARAGNRNRLVLRRRTAR